jgi:hypothetical protein
MKLLPVDDFDIITKLSPEEVQLRLEQEISASGRGFFDKSSTSSNTYFEGYVVNGNFEIQPIINYRNSFLPKITGITKPALIGSVVKIKMRVQSGVLIFMCIWLGFAAIGGIVINTTDISKGQFKVVDLMPFGMFLFGYLLTLGGFKFESNDAKAKLLQILENDTGRTG